VVEVVTILVQDFQRTLTLVVVVVLVVVEQVAVKLAALVVRE
jgi:hypothetical protein